MASTLPARTMPNPAAALPRSRLRRGRAGAKTITCVLGVDRGWGYLTHPTEPHWRRHVHNEGTARRTFGVCQPARESEAADVACRQHLKAMFPKTTLVCSISKRLLGMSLISADQAAGTPRCPW